MQYSERCRSRNNRGTAAQKVTVGQETAAWGACPCESSHETTLVALAVNVRKSKLPQLGCPNE